MLVNLLCFLETAIPDESVHVKVKLLRTQSILIDVQKISGNWLGLKAMELCLKRCKLLELTKHYDTLLAMTAFGNLIFADQPIEFQRKGRNESEGVLGREWRKIGQVFF
jgi:hypothetical protein